MYLHLGQDTIVPKDDIIGIYDLDNCSSSHITRAFLKEAEQRGEVFNVSEDLPKSFVITHVGGQTTVYLSQLSTATLRGRGGTVGLSSQEAVNSWQNQ